MITTCWILLAGETAAGTSGAPELGETVPLAQAERVTRTSVLVIRRSICIGAIIGCGRRLGLLAIVVFGDEDALFVRIGRSFDRVLRIGFACERSVDGIGRPSCTR